MYATAAHCCGTHNTCVFNLFFFFFFLVIQNIRTVLGGILSTLAHSLVLHLFFHAALCKPSVSPKMAGIQCMMNAPLCVGLLKAVSKKPSLILRTTYHFFFYIKPRMFSLPVGHFKTSHLRLSNNECDFEIETLFYWIVTFVSSSWSGPPLSHPACFSKEFSKISWTLAY